MPECLCCGGTDFYLDAGFYYCKECQTQTQELQEQEYEAHDVTVQVDKIKSSKSSQKKQSDKVQITSWECYNYILLGLVNELLELGADEQLKPIVQTIWFTYLRKIEVLHKQPNKIPNLPAYNSRKDALILYGRKDKIPVKRKRKRTSSVSSASSSNTLSSREQNRLKRAMAAAAYDGSTQQSDTSLMNTSLASLQSSGESNKKENYLKFTKVATQELLKKMSKNHLKHHKEDVNTLLSCHNMKYRNISYNYKRSIEVLNQSKVYGILYLGLLISKSQIQLGDMIRFINEGHLSFNYYKHFFPEEYDEQRSFLSEFSSTKALKSHYVRGISTALVKALSLEKSIPLQNLPELFERYIKELNLPEQILEYCLNLLAATKPKLPIYKSIANYEGRVICIILFVLKLFFGLDDVTEHNFSKFAKLASNDHSIMFNFDEWINFLLYRKLIISKHHFPTGFLNKFDDNCKLYVRFMKDYHYKYDLEKPKDVDYDVIEKLLFEVEEHEAKKNYQLNHSLTPFTDYINTLNEMKCLECNEYSIEKLTQSFRYHKLDFLTNPEKILSHRTEVINAGANENIEIVTDGYESIVCNLDFVKCYVTKQHFPENDALNKTAFPLKEALHRFNMVNESFFKRNHMKRNENAFFEEYPKHFKPECRFWFRLNTLGTVYTKPEFDSFFQSLPYSFRVVFLECCRVVSQTPWDLWNEYNLVERYLGFHYLRFDSLNEIKIFAKDNFEMKHVENLW